VEDDVWAAERTSHLPPNNLPQLAAAAAGSVRGPLVGAGVSGHGEGPVAVNRQRREPEGAEVAAAAAAPGQRSGERAEAPVGVLDALEADRVVAPGGEALEAEGERAARRERP
jgi:hypothetical protein